MGIKLGGSKCKFNTTDSCKYFVDLFGAKAPYVGLCCSPRPKGHGNSCGWITMCFSTGEHTLYMRLALATHINMLGIVSCN